LESCALFELRSTESHLNQMGIKWLLESSQTSIECPLNQMAHLVQEAYYLNGS